MFASISINPPCPSGKRVVGKPVEGNNTNYTLGRPEWQQKWETKYQEYFTEKDLHNNREILNQPYLKPNYSGFEYVHFPNKEPFLTSNQRDFKPIHMTEKDRAVLDEKTKNFIRNSKIILGTCPPTKETNYMEVMKDPKNQFCKYNYDKIKFKYDQYNLHPITQQPIFKDPENSWGFDCYNRDKDKKYIANRNMSYINTDYRKVWDPITNRFFYGTLQHNTTQQGN